MFIEFTGCREQREPSQWSSVLMCAVDIGTPCQGPQSLKPMKEWQSLPLVQVWILTVSVENVHHSFLPLDIYRRTLLLQRPFLPTLAVSLMQLYTMSPPPHLSAVTRSLLVQSWAITPHPFSIVINMLSFGVLWFLLQRAPAHPTPALTVSVISFIPSAP